jgi:hypothetical protein
MTSYKIHQQHLWIKICQIANSNSDHEWTPEALAGELGVEVGSVGYNRILEVLQDAEVAQQRERQKIKIGFV